MKRSKWLNVSFVRAVVKSAWLLLLLVVLMAVFQFAVHPNTNARLLTWKLILGVSAAIVGHWIVKALYPYISISDLLCNDRKDEVPDAIKFFGACVLRGLVMGALIVGVLLGV